MSFKSFGLQIRKDGLTHEQYVDHWLNVHAPLTADLTGLIGYVSNEVILTGDALPIPRSHPDFGTNLDGIAQLHFATADGMQRMAGQPAAAALFEDGPKFVGLRTGFFAEEFVVFPPQRRHATHKCILFLDNATVPIREWAGGLEQFEQTGLVHSLLGEPTGSTNLPGLEVPAMDAAVELWATDEESLYAGANALADSLVSGTALVGAVLVSEHVIHEPE